MIKNNLGKLDKIQDLRSIWPHEANDFTQWLIKDENLEILSNTIGISIIYEERESNVGNFNVDIYAKEEETDKNIIIENQLEESNHDHLGKIITYASGKNASYIIWIVKHAREEHRNAIEWLNNHTDDEIGFFLLEIELWKINDSLPAPKFNIVVEPNNWVKEIKKSNDNISETRQIQLLFWSRFKEYALLYNFTEHFKFRKPLPHHWYDIAIGTTQCHISLTINTKTNNIHAGIYIKNNKDLFNKFYEQQNNMENMLNGHLTWNEGKKDAKFYTSKQVNILDENEWNKCFEWFCQKTEILYNIYHNLE